MNQHYVRAALSSGKDHGTHQTGGLVGPQSSFVYFGDKKNYVCIPGFFCNRCFY